MVPSHACGDGGFSPVGGLCRALALNSLPGRTGGETEAP